MAANSSSRGIRVFGKRFTNQIWKNSTSALASRYRYNITLFGTLVGELTSFLIADTTQNAVIVVTFAKLKDFQGQLTLQSSMHASKLKINTGLPEVVSLKNRRAAFSSVYDKNVDDHIHSGPVPDDVIQATQSSKYWGPHPQTGVFGPPGEQATSAPVDACAASVLEEKAWFRPSSLEDLEKPHPHP